MPSDREQIEQILSLTLEQLVQLRASPKPSYTLDGQSVSWETYVASLEQTVDWCQKKLADDLPFEIHSQGYTS